MSVIQQSFIDMKKLAAECDEIMVGFSGGKDSLATLDLCCKTFKRVRPVFWYLVPGLEVIEKTFRWVSERYGVTVTQIPSASLIEAKAYGKWCDSLDELCQLPEEIPLKWVYATALDVTGCQFAAAGMKNADGFQRRQFFANIRDGGDPFWKRLVFPLRNWTKKDVLDYLRVNNIPLPDAEPGSVTSGVGLEHNALCWLHDRHPEDFQKVIKHFPYAEACIKRRDWYGVGQD